MIIGFGNNVISSLAADITASQTTIQVIPGAGAKFAGLLSADYANSSNTQSVYAKITLTDAKETVFEICHLTAVKNDVLTVVRGQEGTAAKGWTLNDVIANFATRGSENQFVQIEQLQSGHYTAAVAGGTANALTVALPATYFVNGSTDWMLRTPLMVYPILNNTGATTIQLAMGGKVLGTLPLYKGNKAPLAAGDLVADIPFVCVLDKTKAFFTVINPVTGQIDPGLFLQKAKNLAEIAAEGAPAQVEARTHLGLKGAAVLDVGKTTGTVAAGDDARITGALQKGNNLSEIATAGAPAQAAARTSLGLKTGAVHDVQPTPTDASPEMLLKMGSFGLGIPMIAQGDNFHTWLTTAASGIYYLDHAMQNATETPAYILVLRNPKGDGVGALSYGYGVGQVCFDSFVKGKWRSWKG
ncbi:hypothetical protein [Cedecea sp. NFIX57]|uniref:hypothetical protein n=1 Tax=Cedecea sp. NFIX57 TaxID=1566286 RepID=UPI000A0BE336|nr:hypothetical protein [Cedecea sp. NFIX57]SMG37129.1 hypothetical protein SAMN03159353_1008149 [Cedecea sp. NFIX57]